MLKFLKDSMQLLQLFFPIIVGIIVITMRIKNVFGWL